MSNHGQAEPNEAYCNEAFARVESHLCKIKQKVKTEDVMINEKEDVSRVVAEAEESEKRRALADDEVCCVLLEVKEVSTQFLINKVSYFRTFGAPVDTK